MILILFINLEKYVFIYWIIVLCVEGRYVVLLVLCLVWVDDRVLGEVDMYKID